MTMLRGAKARSRLLEGELIVSHDGVTRQLVADPVSPELGFLLIVTAKSSLAKCDASKAYPLDFWQAAPTASSC